MMIMHHQSSQRNDSEISVLYDCCPKGFSTLTNTMLISVTKLRNIMGLHEHR